MVASNNLGDMSPSGRPARAKEAAANITLRLTESERERYRAAAARTKVPDKAGALRPSTLAEWIRAACEAHLGATSPPKKGRPR
jgi:hypothetical protein